MGKKHGVDLPMEVVRQRFGAAFAKAFADARSAATSHATEYAKWRSVVSEVFADAAAPVDLLFSDLWRHFGQSESWRLYPDAAPVWRQVTAAGYRVGIASNFDERLRCVLSGLPPLDTCDQVFHSSHVGFAKPHPRFFNSVSQLLKLPPHEILLIGDDWRNDVQGASAAGWRSVFLDRTCKEDRSGVIHSLFDLIPLLNLASP